MTEIKHPQADYNEEKIFVAGLPLKSFRKISEEDVQHLKRLRTSIYFKIVCILLMNPMLFSFAIMIICLFKADVNDAAGSIAVILMMATIMLGIPLMLLMIRDNVNCLKGYNKTLKESKVRCFEGVPKTDPWNKTIINQFGKKGWMDCEDNSQLSIDLLLEEDVLFKVNSHFVSRWFPVDVSTVAVKRPDMPYYDLPTDWIHTDENTDVKRRRLTEGEIIELLAYGKANKGRYFGLLFPMFLIGVNIEKLIKQLEKWNLENYIYLILISLAVLFSLAALGIWKSSWKFKKDAEIGWVLMQTPTYEDIQSAESNEKPVPIEFLMYSGLIWVVDGQPSGWRNKAIDD